MDATDAAAGGAGASPTGPDTGAGVPRAAQRRGGGSGRTGGTDAHLGTDELKAALAAARDQPAPDKPARKRARKQAPAAPPAQPASDQPAGPPDEPESSDPLAGLRRDESEIRRQLGVRVRPSTASRLRRFCALEDIAQGELVDLAITRLLDELEAVGES